MTTETETMTTTGSDRNDVLRQIGEGIGSEATREACERVYVALGFTYRAEARGVTATYTQAEWDEAVQAAYETAAETAARHAGNDGCKATPEQVAIFEAASASKRQAGDATVYEMADGSAIVVVDGWDVRPEGCTGACWDGAGCMCEPME